MVVACASEWFIGCFGLFVTAILATGCQSSNSTRIAAPLPPHSDILYDASMDDGVAPPHTQTVLAVKEEVKEKKACSFSSFQRKNTLGYEWDESTHLSMTVSPKFDVWSMDDFEVKTSVRLTYALSGAANKRPCTFGSGYYGIIPYVSHNPAIINTFTNPSAIKSMLKDKAEERQREADEATISH